MSSDERFAVIALAGGPLERDFLRAGYEAPNKAYLPLAGEPMLTRVLRALRGATRAGRIRCVTEPEAIAGIPQARPLCDDVIAPGEDLIGSVIAGLGGCADAERVLVCATDLPLLTPQAVDGFATIAAATPCDVAYGCVSKTLHDRSYPSVRHTWVKLREGTFCGSGISLLRAGAAREIQEALRRFTGARKSPAKMAALFSPGLALRLLLGSVSITELERRANHLTGLVCRGIECPLPEVAVNIDRLADIAEVEKLL